jgi:hypothetical protein
MYKAANQQGFHRRAVQTGAWSNTQIQILTGLHQGEQVIVNDTSQWSQPIIYLQD